MKIAIVYKSVTGNTKKIAEAVREAVNRKAAELVYFGEPAQGIEADLYFVGSWTDKGTCDKAIAEFLRSLEHKTVAYFGTAGFGGSKEYYETLFSNVKKEIGDSNAAAESFFCQGKMMAPVRKRYEGMLQEHPDDQRALAGLQNFDRAMSHPDENDCLNAEKWAEAMLDPKK